MLVQLLTVYTDPELHNVQRCRRTITLGCQ